jgi:hypothetical protein
VAETPDKASQDNEPPEAAQQGASGRVPAIVVSLSALAIIGAATAVLLPSFNRLSLPNFNRFSLPKLDFSLPNFDQFALPSFDRFTAPPPRETASAPIPKPSAPIPVASAPIPDPVVTASLRDIQSSQQQNAAMLVSLTQSSASQQADLKRISRQLSALATQVDALQNSVTPLTTSSIPHSTSIPRSNPRARVIRTPQKTAAPPLPKPVGPVSVGGAPLSPAPASSSGAG